MDLTGQHLGAYEIWGPIGEGGMSRVWLARHRELGIPVIVKTLRDSPDEGAYDRLLNEARLMARVPGPRVVRAVDAGTHEGVPYIVQEYIDGLDLAELDRRRRHAVSRALPLWFVCHVAYEVADALYSAHQAGVLHRDVKPSNLLGSPQGGTRLGDFGIAMARGFTQHESTGTLRFVAPEALRGDKPSRRCDVYSLGATAYDLRYGRPPFRRISGIMSEEPPRFPEPKNAEEAYFQHVLRHMLAKAPPDRYGTVAKPRRLFASLARSLRPRLVCVPVAPGVYQLGRTRIRCTVGDIAEAVADGIVNAANDQMTMRTGVGDALRARGGQVLEDEAAKEGRRALSDCVVTSPGTLACRHVIHAVSAWKQASCIARTCQRLFLVANELDMKSLALPALGTGKGRVGAESSAYAMVSALYQHVALGGSKLRDVEIVLNDRELHGVFVEGFDEYLLGESELITEAGPRGDADLAADPTLMLPRVEG